MHIINSLIALVVALFFWKDASKEVVEKTRNASKWKTALYLILFSAVLAFYIKTYQVVTVVNLIGIEGVVASKSQGELIDTAVVSIHNKLFHKGSYTNRFKSLCDYSEDDLSNYGGIQVDIYPHVNPDTLLISCWEDSDYITKDSLLALQKQFPNFQHLYRVRYYATSVPNLIPFESFFDKSSDWKVIGDNSFSRTKKYSHGYDRMPYTTYHMRDTVPNGIFRNPYYQDNYVGTFNISKDESAKYIELKSMSSFDLNSINIFSAADISQITYTIAIDSKIPVDHLYVDFDVPIELCTQAPFIEEGVFSFVAHAGRFEDDKWDFNKASTLDFHVKFPTMANLQLIRSFILTLLLSALFSLSFKNLYYLSRKFFVSKKGKIQMLINENSIIKIKKISKLIAILSFILLIAYIYFLCTDTPVLLPVWMYENLLWIIIGVLIIVIVVVLLTILYVVRILNKTK